MTKSKTLEDYKSKRDFGKTPEPPPRESPAESGASAFVVHRHEARRLHYDLRLEIVNPTVDPTFSFMTLDHDGKIRMDCSSPYAMARLVDLRNQYDIAFGNDTDFDRHGIVTSSWGLLNPNHYLSVAISYLFTERDWHQRAAVGKTLVSSAMIDRSSNDR